MKESRPLSILAPLRGVTIRCFRKAYATEIAEAGFDEAVTPFIPAMPGVDPLKDRELRSTGRVDGAGEAPLRTVPQFIGKDPQTLSRCLSAVRGAGWRFADLNCGCPFPMVRNKGRGSGLLKTPKTLEAMIRAGCEAMGAGAFSVKARLGVDSPGELLGLMDMINSYPLRYLAVHARTARQMYEGPCDIDAFRRVADAAEVPVVYNGDAASLRFPADVRAGRELLFARYGSHVSGVMCGRAFVRSLGEREDSRDRLGDYIDLSLEELGHPSHVVGRIKEIVSYWKDLPGWSSRWNALKMARSLPELRMSI